MVDKLKLKILFFMFKKINHKKEKGFTLIELLIVVAIIGILAAIVSVAIGDVLQRARDVRRMADVRQLAFILEREVALGHSVTLTGCGANATTTACTGPGSNAIAGNFTDIRDPQVTVGAGGVVTSPACASGFAGTICQYGIRNEPPAALAAASTHSYQICFRIEIDPDGVGPLVAGLNSIRTGVRFVSGCL
jgi:prepilin-type N-terminal cleavage/methylation domain-containing protein